MILQALLVRSVASLGFWIGCVVSPRLDAPPPAPGTEGGKGLALLASKILTAAREGEQVIDHGVVLIEDGLLRAVGARDEVRIPRGYVVEDVGENWLMPGMVELHNHIGSTRFWEVNSVNDTVYLTNPGLRASSLVEPDNLHLREGLAGGVTTALFLPGSGSNMGGQGVLFKLGRRTYEEMELRSPGALKLAQAGNPEDWAIGVARTFMNWNTRETFRRGLAYAKRWEAFERGEGEEPRKDIQLEVFRDLYEKKTQVATHTQFHQVVLMTVNMVRREFGLDVYIDHGTFGGYKAAGEAQAAGVPAILGPRLIINHRGGGSWEDIDTDGAILGIPAMYQANGHELIGFNTDCVDNGASGMTPPQHELSLQAAMAVRYGLDSSELEHLRGLTIVPAIACGLDERIGSLEVGKDADVLVVTGDPADPRSSVERVYTDGIVVYDPEVEGRRW